MNIWDKFGHKIGEVSNDGKNVYDGFGQPNGKVGNTGTFDKTGSKISSTRDAGLAIPKKGKL